MAARNAGQRAWAQQQRSVKGQCAVISGSEEGAPCKKKKKVVKGEGLARPRETGASLEKKSSSWPHKFGGLKRLFECAGGGDFFRFWAGGAEAFPSKTRMT